MEEPPPATPRPPSGSFTLAVLPPPSITGRATEKLCDLRSNWIGVPSSLAANPFATVGLTIAVPWAGEAFLSGETLLAAAAALKLNTE
jgi:hypothetical protein